MQSQGNDVVTARVRRKLRRLRLAIRLQWACEAGAWIVVALAAVVGVTLLCDWGLSRLARQPVGLSLRVAVLAVSVLVAASVVWRRALRWALTRWSDEEAAIIVERRYGQLGDRLISSVQFSSRRWRDDPTVSAALVAMTAQQACEIAETLSFSAVLDRRPVARRVAAAAVATVLVGALAFWAPQTMRTWFDRNVMLTDVAWARQTYLTVTDGPQFAVLRGGNLIIEARALSGSTVVPDEVVFHIKTATSGSVAESVDESARPGRYVKTFANVSESFTFYVTGHDGRTDACEVRVVEPIEVRDIRFGVEYPGYMERPARWFAGNTSSAAAHVDSWVTVVAATTKEISAARFVLDGVEVGEPRIQPVTVEGADEPVSGVVCRFQFPSPGRDAQGNLIRRAKLEIVLTDSEGYTPANPPAYPIKVDVDAPPTVEATWLSQGVAITARGIVPAALVADDDCGLVELHAELTVTNEAAEADPVSTTRTLPIATFTPRRKRVEINPYRIDLEGRGLRTGDRIQLAVVGSDSMPDAAGGPNVHRSEVRHFRVVSEADMKAELLTKQKQMRLRMDNTIEAQVAAWDMVRAAASEASGGGPAEARRLGGAGARKQQSVAALAGAIAAEYRSIVQTMEDNRMDPDQRTRMTRQIIEPLEALVREPMPAALVTLNAAVGGNGAAPAADVLGRVAQTQAQWRQQLETIRRSMVELNDLQDLARILTGIITVTEEVKGGIRRRMDERTGGLFDPAD